jgi:hypothetical protein
MFVIHITLKITSIQIWTENADGSGTTNFITGMGGYLHSLIFGYAGVRFDKDSLSVNCSPFPDTSSYR